VTSFAGSAGWFERVEVRCGFYRLKLKVEAATVGLVAAEELPATQEEHEYFPEQVFSLDETGLFWKRMQSRTFVSVPEEVALGFKASEDSCMLLLGGNVFGDFEIKPLTV
jgi:hypothetical protein